MGESKVTNPQVGETVYTIRNYNGYWSGRNNPRVIVGRWVWGMKDDESVHIETVRLNPSLFTYDPPKPTLYEAIAALRKDILIMCVNASGNYAYSLVDVSEKLREILDQYKPENVIYHE